MFDRTFRQVARYVYAVNQGPARFVLDPIYDVVARTLVPADAPLSPKLRNKKYPPDLDLYFRYRKFFPKRLYDIEDWDFREARPDLLTPRQRDFLHTAAMGETSGSAVSAAFLKTFRTVPELAAFFGHWFVEELNHFIGFHRYIEQMGEGWPEERAMRIAAVDAQPYSTDPYELAAGNMYQEMIGFLVYRAYSQQVQDPFLARMLAQFAKDECRHFKYYQDVVARKIQQEPSFRRRVMRIFLKATTPYNQVSGSARATLDHLQKGMFYFRKKEFDYFLKQTELLFGDSHESFFRWFFRDHHEPCEGCHEQLFLCECSVYEPPASSGNGALATAAE